jgi:integrase
MTWQQAIYHWTLALRAAGRRPRTIELYRHYANYLADRLDPDPWAVRESDLEDLLGSAEWGPSARKSLRTVTGSFYAWGHRRGHIATDPAAELPTVRVSRGKPRPTPEDVILTALERADERDRNLVDLGALVGLRAGEMCQVHSDDLDENDLLLVHGKGGKERHVPIEDHRLAAAIRNAGGWLFPNTQRGGHLTSNYVGHRLSRLLPGKWTAHTLRHRFGTQAFAGTHDLPAVSELLGHASLDTTRTYVEVPGEFLRAAVRAAGNVGREPAPPPPRTEAREEAA